MTRSCHQCRLWESGEVDPEVGRLGKCLLARQRYDGDVTRPWSYPACKGFESKDETNRRRPAPALSGGE